MKIKDVKTIPLRVPLKNEIVSSLGSWKHRNGMFVLIETDTDLTGIGETWINFPSWGQYERQATILEGIKPLLIGEDPENISALRNKINKKLERIGLQWGAVGVMSQAISGIDIALWDLKGKLLGKPICELLGGKPYDVPIYASALGPNNVEEDAKRYLDKGVKAFKLKIGIDKVTDKKNIKDLRKLIGDDNQLMVDANQAWTVEESLEMIEYLNEYNIYWLEEPIRADDFLGTKQVKNEGGIKVAVGENIYGYTAFKNILNMQAVDILQPDITKCGGISDMVPLCQMLPSWGVDWAPHFLSNGVGLAATLQVMGAVPGGLILEYDHNYNEMRDECVTGLGEIRDGKLRVPEGPGLGVDLNWEAIERYRFKL